MDKPSRAVVPRTLDYCFFAGYSEAVLVNVQEKKDLVEVSVEVHGPAVPAGDQLERCVDSLRELLNLDKNTECNEVYHGESVK